MSVKRTPPYRAGIIEMPGKVTVSLGRLVKKGKRVVRRVTTEGASALEEIFARIPGSEAVEFNDRGRAVRRRVTPPVTFEDLVSPTETLARRVVEKNGGVPAGGAWGHVEEASELAYALELLRLLRFARSNDVDEARRHAWLAGALAQEAFMKFRWEAHALHGERDLANRQRAAAAANQEKRSGDRAAALAAERRRWSDVNASLDPDMPRSERARIIATRCDLASSRRVYDYLSTQAPNNK